MRHRTPTLILLLVGLLLGWPVPAYTQVNCTTTLPTTPVALVPGQSVAVWQQLDHTTIDPDGVAVITSYRGEVALASDPTFTKVITNWTIPKASVTQLPAGAGANCVSTVIPALTPLAQSINYVSRIISVGRNPMSGVAAVSNPFFLAGVPLAPANTRVGTP